MNKLFILISFIILTQNVMAHGGVLHRVIVLPENQEQYSIKLEITPYKDNSATKGVLNIALTVPEVSFNDHKYKQTILRVYDENDSLIAHVYPKEWPYTKRANKKIHKLVFLIKKELVKYSKLQIDYQSTKPGWDSSYIIALSSFLPI